MSRCTACASTIPADAEFCPVCAATAPEHVAPEHVAPPSDAGPERASSQSAGVERPALRQAVGERGADEPSGGAATERRSVWSRLFGRGQKPTPAATVPAPSPGAPPVAGSPAAGPPVPAPTAAPPAAQVAAPLAPRPVEISPEIIAAVPGFSREPQPVDEPAAPEPVAPEPTPATPPEPAEPEPAEPEPAEPEPAEPTPTPATPPEPADVDRTRLSSAASAASPPVLVLPGGERLEVVGAGVLGRNPAAIVGHDVTHVVPVADPTRSVSKTHLGFGVDAVGLWIKDLHSTNGTAVRSPEGVRTLLQPGLAVHVTEGDVVVVGDVELEVTR